MNTFFLSLLDIHMFSLWKYQLISSPHFLLFCICNTHCGWNSGLIPGAVLRIIPGSAKGNIWSARNKSVSATEKPWYITSSFLPCFNKLSVPLLMKYQFSLLMWGLYNILNINPLSAVLYANISHSLEFIILFYLFSHVKPFYFDVVLIFVSGIFASGITSLKTMLRSRIWRYLPVVSLM